MKILIITGGTTSERQISLLSAKQVQKTLEKEKHRVSLFDLKKGYSALKKLLPEFDICFPVLHGEEGEGGKLQGFLKENKARYVGGDPKGFQEGWFKISFKKFCDKNKITTSPWKVVKNLSEIKSFGFPAVLKSSSGGSSKEVIILKSPNDLKKKSCLELISSRFDLFVEKYLPGTEATVAILDNKALPVIEIIPPKGSWFNFRNKYSGKTKEIVGAPSLTENMKKRLQKIALLIHQKLNLGPYSRIDFIISNKVPFVLEINTIPGLTTESLFPKAAKSAGLPFPKLMDKIAQISYADKVFKTK